MHIGRAYQGFFDVKMNARVNFKCPSKAITKIKTMFYVEGLFIFSKFNATSLKQWKKEQEQSTKKFSSKIRASYIKKS